MNPALASEIVHCLRVSGFPRVEFGRSVSRRQWEHALEWLDHSGIALLFWNRLKEIRQEVAIPSEIGERLEANLADHRLRVAEMVAEFDSINQHLAGASVPYAAIKGLTLIPEYCPDIFLRTTYDYDYLLPRESIAAAEKALTAAGYVRQEDPEEHPIVYFHEAHPPRTPLSRDDLYSTTFPRTVELHYLFWDPDPVKIPLNLPADPMAQLELRCIPAFPNHPGPSWPGTPVHFYAVTEDNELIFQVLHIFRHILRDWCRLCSILDIAYFLDRRASDAAFWDRFLEHLKPSQELSEIVGVVFLLAAGLFGAQIPSVVAERTTRCLRRSLVSWVERYGKNSALQNFSDNKFSLFLHREFIRDDATWRAIQRSRLFPIHRPNEPVRAPSSTLQSRLAADWRQRFHVAQRLRHHLVATMRYGLESPRWRRRRFRDE